MYGHVRNISALIVSIRGNFIFPFLPPEIVISWKKNLAGYSSRYPLAQAVCQSLPPLHLAVSGGFMEALWKIGTILRIGKMSLPATSDPGYR
jgi:hypothetical protein